ncbi:inverse autotransporter beta domain-containing protein [Thorsellia anophelis]|uniref:Invasin beta-domain of outer membrane n=1 Tax=Thorsellia anophelis DSM 18579 TaxID=1123402 RepID=A0A1I0C979_9GAMM|nr:inverse autotransporter beta domain-containing protein [Thorsellia anophelis]SET16009.1 Invasin beta-domain of outer membrane [Thorsellia anophelis DSM 18579]
MKKQTLTYQNKLILALKLKSVSLIHVFDHAFSSFRFKYQLSKTRTFYQLSSLSSIAIVLLLLSSNSYSDDKVLDNEQSAITPDLSIASIMPKTHEYVIESEMTLYQLSLKSGVGIETIKALNPKLQDENQTLLAGASIDMPETALENLTSAQKVKPSGEPVTSLPTLGAENNNAYNTQLVQKLPGSRYVAGTTEENTANVLSDAATRNWKQFNAKQLQNEAENYLINGVKSEINQQANTLGNEFLGRFGKAKVNISIDEKGNIAGSSFNLLSPLYDDTQSLIFSQVGVHGQGSGVEKRTIGNFGLGYRYETDDWLAGSNIFIDHDFTGENTRLGLGAEWWVDYAKLAANTYYPLSDWKTSEVMKHYEALIYDERPAKGFDIRAQAYLPSYPHLGGSLAYEHYFGDEVALFSTKERQKDPYAVTVGLDYTPIPLLTAKAAHRVGKNSQHDARFDLNLNFQLGTPLEAQLDPNNVRLARSLKGSRYDLVDRNYDIVFEYRQENFTVDITGPTEAQLAQSVTFDSTIQSRAPISEYKWVVTNQLGGERYEWVGGTQFNFTPTQLRPYFIRLIVTTERGAVGESNIIRLDVNAFTTSLFDYTEDSTPHAEVLESVIAIDEPTIEALGNSHTIKMTFIARGLNEEPVELPEYPYLEWRFAGEEEFRPFDSSALEFGLRYIVVRDTDDINVYHFTVVGDKTLLLDGTTRLVQFRAYSITHPHVASPNYLEGQFIQSSETQFVDPNNVVLEIHQITNTDLSRALVRDPVAIAGRINGQTVVLENAKPIGAGRYYEVQIKRVNPSTQEMEDVTDYFENSLTWLYWDPVIGKEISTELNDQRTLESCIGYPVYSTQVNNYDNNELSWGKIMQEHSADVPSEQGLRLAVKFDFTAIQDPSTVKVGRDRVCYPTSETQAETDYLGYTLVNGETIPKAVEWNR